MSRTENEISKLFESSVIVLFGILFGKIIALFAEALIARSLSPPIYGSLALAYTVTLLSGRIAMLGVENAIARMVSVALNRSDRVRFIQHGFGIILVTGSLVTVSLVLARNVIGSIVDDPLVGQYIIYFIPFIILYSIRGIAFNTLRAEERTTSAALSRDLIGRLVPFTILAGALLLGMPVIGAVTYWVSVPLIITLAAFFFMRGQYPISELVAFYPDRETIWQLGRFSLPLAVSTYMFLFLSYFDVLMIGFFLEPNRVGFYRAIQPLQQASTILITAFTFLFLPVVARMYEQNHINSLGIIYTTSTKWLTAGTLPIVLVFGLFTEDLIRTLFGAAYLPAAPALTLLVSGQFFRTVVGLNGDIVKAIDRTEVELGSAVVGVFVNIVLNIYLIPRYGIAGAAIGTVAGYLVYNVVEVAAIYWMIGIHPFSFNNFKPLVVTIGFALGIRHLTAGAEFGIIGLGGLGALFALVVFASMIFTRSLDKTDTVLLNRVEERTGFNLKGSLRALWP